MLIDQHGTQKHANATAALCAAIGVLCPGMTGCDSLVSPEYVGESRLALRVSVQNSAPANKGKIAGKDKIVPALAHSQGGRIRFDALEPRGDFPADFYVYAFGEPSAEQDAFAALAPDSAVALLYLAAVPERLRDEPAYILPGDAVSPVCWDGNCDDVPGRRIKSEPCAENGGSPCVQRDGECPEGDCGLSPEGTAVAQLARDWVGFSQDHVVLHARKPVAAGSWPALRVGAADGLPAGYHLLALSTPDEETQQRSADCLARAADDYLEQFNAAHDSHYTSHALDCLIAPEEQCGPYDAPTGAAAEELAKGLAQSEIDHACLGIAADLTVVEDTANETVNVRIGDYLPIFDAMPRIRRDESTSGEGKGK